MASLPLKLKLFAPLQYVNLRATTMPIKYKYKINGLNLFLLEIDGYSAPL